MGHLGRSWTHLWPVGGLSRTISVRPCRFIWFVGVHLGPSWPAHAALSGLSGSILAHIGQPMPFHLACRGPSSQILANPCRFIWLVGVHLGPSWLAHAALSGFLGSSLAHLSQPMPFHLLCRGPSCPIFASPFRFIWLVWVHPGTRASPCRFCWLLGVHLEPFWGRSCRFICFLGDHLGPFQTILGQPLPL